MKYKRVSDFPLSTADDAVVFGIGGSGNIKIRVMSKAAVEAAIENVNVRVKGFFVSEESLNTRYPQALIGDRAYVGTSVPYSIFEWDGTAWVDTGQTDLEAIQETILANAPYQEITWSELRTLRDGGLLVKGRQYRITDYITTTTQEDSQSAGHQFDVIVIADDESTLNEVARACLHEGDTYFSGAGANLEAWELKYCIDNDTNRFAWADSTNGKGVIYYMKDEHNNECSYDFKNIQFKRYKITSFTKPDIVNSDTMSLLYAQESSQGYGYEVDMNDYIYCYTFATNQTNDNEDLSVAQLHTCKDNKIESYESNNSIKMYLNNNVLFDDESYSMIYNHLEIGSHHNTFLGFQGNKIREFFRYNIGCDYYCNIGDYYVEFNLTCNMFTFNTLGHYFKYNIIGTDSNYNHFGDYVQNNTIGSEFNANVTDHGFRNNTIGEECKLNTFGENFVDNIISDTFQENTVSHGTTENNFGSGFKFNNCGSYFRNNTFGDKTEFNNFGSAFTGNEFGSSVGINMFGEQCKNNKFGSNIVANVFHPNSASNTIGSDFRYNTGHLARAIIGNNVTTDVENGAFVGYCDFGSSRYFNLLVPPSASTESRVINLKFCNIQGTESAYIDITPPVTNQDYELKVAKNSAGDVKIYCEADLIQ